MKPQNIIPYSILSTSVLMAIKQPAFLALNLNLCEVLVMTKKFF